ncbi:hypothetical protein OG747_39245 [Streptomyces sp. NBC_01384]|uniref:3-oxoacyl-[acyl-carrier-protein] synthase III C-terminal domain-containing protein n=1 Tax=Streptomyces sp. NBC_01384 TaxID=2903847 RepID=UPI00324379BA
MSAAVVCGIGACLPERVVRNDDLTARLDTSDAWIRSRTGIARRRIAEPGTSTGDLAVLAGRAALDSAGHAAASIPLALADTAARGLVRPGERSLLTAFGGGLTWGSIALSWPNAVPVHHPLSIPATRRLASVPAPSHALSSPFPPGHLSGQPVPHE